MEEDFLALHSYVMSCRRENTDEYMQGLAEILTRISQNLDPGNVWDYDQRHGVMHYSGTLAF